MSDSFHLSDIGVEEPPPPVSVPKVDAGELEKGRFILRYVQPEDVAYDSVIRRHTCRIQSSTTDLKKYFVTISYNSDSKDWSNWTCECPQATSFDAPCKHIIAFFLFIMDEQNPSKPIRPTLPSTAAKSIFDASNTRGPSNATSSAAASSASSLRPALTHAPSKPNPPSPQRRPTFASAAPSTVRMTSPRKPVDSMLGTKPIQASTRANLAPPPTSAISSLSSTNSHLPIPSDAGSARPSGGSGHSPVFQSSVVGAAAAARIPFSASVLAPRLPRDAWKCAMCAARNVSAATRCRECSAIRKNDSVTPTPASAPPNTWRCVFCAFDNKYSESPTKCKICEGAHPTPPSSNGSVASGGAPSNQSASASTSHHSDSLILTPAPANTATSAAAPAVQIPAVAGHGTISLSFDSVPPFPDSTNASTTAVAPAFISTTKKAMSVIPESLPLDGSQASNNGRNETEEERQRRWRALLDQPISTAPTTSAAAAASSAADRQMARSSATATGASSAAASSSRVDATDLTVDKPLIINFTNGRGGGISKAKNKAPIVLPTEAERLAKEKREQEARDRALAEELAQKEQNANERPSSAKKPRTKAATTKSPKPKSTKETKPKPKAKPKKRKRKFGEDYDSSSATESEYEELEEEKKHETEDEKEEEEVKAVDDDGDIEMKDAPPPPPLPSAVAATSAAPSDNPAVVLDGKPHARVMPSFLAKLAADPKPKRGAAKVVAMTGASNTKTSRKRAKKEAAPEEETKEEADVNESMDEPKPKKKAAPRKKPTTTATKPRAKRSRRVKDEDSQEDSEWDGEDLDLRDDDEKAQDEEVDDLPPLVDPSKLPSPEIPKSLLKVAEGSELLPEDIMALAAHFQHENPDEKKAHTRSAAAPAPTEKPAGICETSLAETLHQSKLLLAQLAGPPAAPPVEDIKPRKKRRINLKDLIGDAPKLYELIQAPPTQTSQDDAVQILDQPHHEAIPMDEDEKTIAEMLGDDTNETASKASSHRPTRQSSRQSVLAAAASRQPSNTSTNSNKPPARTSSGATASSRATSVNHPQDPIEVDLDEDMEAGLEDMLFADAPKPIPREQFKFKAERDAEEEEKKKQAEKEMKEQRDASLDMDEPRMEEEEDGNEVVLGPAGCTPAELHPSPDADDVDLTSPQPTEWRKVERVSSQEREKRAALAKKVNKPRKAPVKRKPSTKKVKEEQIEIDSNSDVDPTSENRHKPSSLLTADHPLSRYETATLSIIPIFPQMELKYAAAFLAHFNDDVEKTVGWLVEHTDESERLELIQGPAVQTESHSKSSKRDKPAPITRKPSGRNRKRSISSVTIDEEDAPEEIKIDDSTPPITETQVALEDAVDSLFSPGRSVTTTSRKSKTPARASSTSSPLFKVKLEDSADEDFNPMDDLFPDDGTSAPPPAPTSSAPVASSPILSPATTAASSSRSSPLPPPRVVCMKRAKGEIVQDCDVYIGRAQFQGGWKCAKSEWFNPYSVKEYGRDVCLEKYREYLLQKPELLNKLRSLSGKTLGCWCAPSPCHGDIIVQEFKRRYGSKPCEKDGDMVMTDAATGGRSSSLVQYYQSDEFDSKLQSAARLKERERRARESQPASVVASSMVESAVEEVGMDDREQLLEEKYAEDEPEPEMMPAPEADIYHFDVSQPSESDGCTTVPPPPPANMGWSKKKATVPVEEDVPLPNIIKQRQLRAQIQHLETLKRRQGGGQSIGSSPARPARPGYGSRASGSGSGSSVRSRRPPVDINQPRASRSAAAAAAASRVTESSLAAAELQAHRKRLREGRSATGTIKEEEEEGEEEKEPQPKSEQETQLVRTTEPQTHSLFGTSASLGASLYDDEMPVPAVARGRRTDVEVRSRRK